MLVKKHSKVECLKDPKESEKGICYAYQCGESSQTGDENHEPNIMMLGFHFCGITRWIGP